MQASLSKPAFLPSAAPSPAPAPVRAPAASTPVSSPSGPSAPHPFAQMLKQNQTPHAKEPAPKAPSPAEDAPRGDAADATPVDADASESTAPHGRSADAPGRARSTRGDERSTARAARPAAKHADTPIPSGEDKAAETDDPAKALGSSDAAFAVWPGERSPMAVVRDAAASTAGADAERGELGIADSAQARGASEKIDTANTHRAEADSRGDDPEAKGESKAFVDLVAQRLAIELPPAALGAERATAAHQADAFSPRLEGIAATPLFSAAAFTPAAAAGPIASPVDVRLATPVDSPDFAQALGAQVSVLAGNGVQRAELHLNPAEMGPVSVQIVVDGGQARVEFGADFAATRQAIENGLPELASALRDAGLTLTGGGVSQHARGRGDPGAESGANPRRNAGSGGDAEPVVPLRPRSIAVGGVDLYA